MKVNRMIEMFFRNDEGDYGNVCFFEQDGIVSVIMFQGTMNLTLKTDREIWDELFENTKHYRKNYKSWLPAFNCALRFISIPVVKQMPIEIHEFSTIKEAVKSIPRDEAYRLCCLQGW